MIRDEHADGLRLECLRLASNREDPGSDDEVLARAKAFAAFVLASPREGDARD